MCLGLVVHTVCTLWTEWLNFVCKKVVLIGPRSARVPAVCGTIKRPQTIKNLTKPVFTHLSHQVSNKKIALEVCSGKTHHHSDREMGSLGNSYRSFKKLRLGQFLVWTLIIPHPEALHKILERGV